MKPVPWAAFACLAASMALVGSYVGLSRLLVAAFPVFLLAWLRFGIAAVAMLTWLRRKPGEAALSPRDRRLLFWESFLGNFGFSICMLFGVAATLAGIALLALARGPEDAGQAPAAPWWGYALLLGAVVCEASYVVIGKRLAGSVSPQRISAVINLWGLALITPMGLWQAWSFPFESVQASTWGLLVFYALAASVVTVWLWMRGLQHVPASQAGIFTVCLPLSAAAVGVVWLGEPFGPVHGMALGMALAGLVLATWPSRAEAGQR